MVSSPTERDPVVVVAGPTASGKSGVGIELAQRFGGEILNADSMQVFRFLDIGTAKPSLEERQRVPHHLFDLVAPDERYSAGRYARDARAVADEVHRRGALPIAVGGSGLYLRAFLEGVVDTPEVDLERRQALEAEAEAAAEEGDPHRLHRRLAELDPESARRIHPNDRHRTMRALEILESSGEVASALRDAHRFREHRYRVLYLVLDPGREELDRRIEARARSMVEAGLLRELREALERGYSADDAPLRAIGYRHLLRVAEGLETLDYAREQMVLDTRRFARRQRTWFRAVPEARWFDPRALPEIAEAVQGFLEGRGE